MSYQQSYHHTTTGGQHRLTEFVPNYVPHSDYLPSNRITDNQHEANQWVRIHLCSCLTTSSKKDWDTSTLPSPKSSTLGGTSRSGPTKTSKSIIPSPRTSSTAESGGTESTDRHLHISPITLYHLPATARPSRCLSALPHFYFPVAQPTNPRHL